MITEAVKNTQTQSVKNQYLAAFVVNLLMIGYGLATGWASPSIVLLTSDESPLPSGKISMEQASWLAALLPLGSLFGNVVFWFVMEKFGRKRPLLCISIPLIISWLLVLFPQNVYYLYVARFLHGMNTGASLSLVPVYMLEIANDEIRGILGSTILLVGHLALVLAFLFGNYCSFNVPPIFMIIVTILFVILFWYFPETPIFLVRQNKILEAERSIRFYRNITEKSDVSPQLELDRLKRAIEGSNMKESRENSLTWEDLTTRPGSKAMIIGIVLAFFTQFSGAFTMMSYAASIFKQAGSSVSPNMSVIILGIIQFLGTFVIIFVVDRAGRKILFTVSTIGTAMGYIWLGTFIMLDSWHYDVESYRWIPVVSLSFIIFNASLAISSLQFTVIAECMPEKLKNFGVAFCLALMSVCTFILLKCLPLLTELLGLHGCMFMFAGVCFSCTIFVVFFIPETKGKSYEQIMMSLR